MINKDQVIARTRELYEEKLGYVWDGYTAPELRPPMSRQVAALAQALAEAINANRFPAVVDKSVEEGSIV